MCASLGAVGRGIDADDSIDRAQQQAVEDGGGDAARIVRRMIGLQADRQPAGQPDRIAEAGDDRGISPRQHEVLCPS